MALEKHAMVGGIGNMEKEDMSVGKLSLCRC